MGTSVWKSILRCDRGVEHPCEQIGDEIVHRAMSGMLDLANVLQLLIDGLDDRPLPEQQLVMQTHQRVLHVPLEPGDQVYAVHEESLEEILADVSPIGEQLAKQLFREAFVFQRSAVVDIARGQLPLHDLALVVDDQVQLESVEPAHRALAQSACLKEQQQVHPHLRMFWLTH